MVIRYGHSHNIDVHEDLASVTILDLQKCLEKLGINKVIKMYQEDIEYIEKEKYRNPSTA